MLVTGLIFAIVAAVAASWSALSAQRAARAAEKLASLTADTLRHMRADSANRSRPYMGAELIKGAPSVQELVIRNFGVVEAHKVTVSFEPPLPEIDDETGDAALVRILRQRYTEPIPVLVPSQLLSNIYYYGYPANVLPLPEKFTVNISYAGPGGETFTSSFPLNVDLLRKHSDSTPQRTGEDQQLREEAVDALNVIAAMARRRQ
jgi:hypothetical protein